MRRTLAAIFMVLLTGTGNTQPGNNPEIVIQRMFDQGSLEGHDQKVLGTTGDAAAVILTKVIAGKTLTADQIDTSLLILNMAFADPQMVQNAPDRDPRTALFVLQAFDHLSAGPALRERIAQTREYVQSRHRQMSKPSN